MMLFYNGETSEVVKVLEVRKSTVLILRDGKRYVCQNPLDLHMGDDSLSERQWIKFLELDTLMPDSRILAEAYCKLIKIWTGR